MPQYTIALLSGSVLSLLLIISSSIYYFAVKSIWEERFEEKEQAQRNTQRYLDDTI
ncbi:MAG TPA: hypothetical protein VN372_01270 [Methanospirillum sp.]|nr:hypothetical protein [Methanospirillum sp.]